jgi:6-phosphogluconolactonase
MKNFALEHFPTDVALAQKAAKDWLSLLDQARPAPYSVALSGGRITKTFFAAIADQARATGTGLDHVHFFWADERCVPPDNPDSNFKLAEESLFKPLGIARDHIHRLKGELDPVQAVAEANLEIGEIVPKSAGGLPVLDMIFLGLGENAHIASLMPNAPEAVNNSRAAYVGVDNSPKPPPNRITLTYAAIAAAKEMWMLASGAAKQEALAESLQPGATTPFARVLGSRSWSRIYTDIESGPKK